MFGILLYAAAMGVLLLSFSKDRGRTKKALIIAQKAFLNILPPMLTIIGLIGLVLAVTPPEVISGLFGTGNAWGTLLIALVGAVTLIPAFIAFPLAASLLHAGAGVVAVASFITTLTMVGIVTAPLEKQYFGTRFVIARNALSFILAMIIGGLMGVLLR